MQRTCRKVSDGLKSCVLPARLLRVMLLCSFVDEEALAECSLVPEEQIYATTGMSRALSDAGKVYRSSYRRTTGREKRGLLCDPKMTEGMVMEEFQYAWALDEVCQVWSEGWG